MNVEKKSQITVGGIVDDKPNGPAVMAALSPEMPSEEITTVDNPRRRSSAPPAAAPTAENAAALRQIRGEPEPIPEGKLYAIQCHDAAGGNLGKQIAGSDGEGLTHAAAVEMCLTLNEDGTPALMCNALAEVPEGCWFGVVFFEVAP